MLVYQINKIFFNFSLKYQYFGTKNKKWVIFVGTHFLFCLNFLISNFMSDFYKIDILSVNGKIKCRKMVKINVGFPTFIIMIQLP